MPTRLFASLALILGVVACKVRSAPSDGNKTTDTNRTTDGGGNNSSTSPPDAASFIASSDARTDAAVASISSQSSGSDAPTDVSKEPTSSEAAATSSGSETRNPRFDVEGSLNLEPELLLPLPLGNGQVHNVQATDDWVYFSGRISTGLYPAAESVNGMGVFRMGKQPDAHPEALFAAKTSTFFYRYHWDGRTMYYLDWERVKLWQETASDVAPTIVDVALDSSHDFIGGDEDSIFAYTNNCLQITIIDKATLVTRVVQPPNAWAAGGVWGLASDGKTLYCTGIQEADSRAVVYAIDKTSGAVKETTITHKDNSNLLQMAPGFIDDGSLYQIMTPHHFGKLNLATGEFTTLAANPGAWATVPVHHDAGSRWVYWVGTENVWRYNLSENTYVPFMNHNMLIAGRSSMDSDYVYFVTGYDANDRPDDIVGIVRVAKPVAP